MASELNVGKVVVNDTTAGSTWNTIGSFQRGGDEVLAVRSNGDNAILANNDTAGYIGFATGTGAPTRLTIDSDGKMGVNATPSGTFHTVGLAGTTAMMVVGASGNNIANFYDSSSAAQLTITSAGGIVCSSMPTSDPSVAGQLWNDSGTVKISAG